MTERGCVSTPDVKVCICPDYNWPVPVGHCGKCSHNAAPKAIPALLGPQDHATVVERVAYICRVTGHGDYADAIQRIFARSETQEYSHGGRPMTLKEIAEAEQPSEGYPGIAHDFETMRAALQKIADDWPRSTNEGAQKWARDALKDIPEGRGSAPAGTLATGSPHAVARDANHGGATPGGVQPDDKVSDADAVIEWIAGQTKVQHCTPAWCLTDVQIRALKGSFAQSAISAPTDAEDAARYRWMRKHEHVTIGRDSGELAVWWDDKCETGTTLDEAIDAAMGAETDSGAIPK